MIDDAIPSSTLGAVMDHHQTFATASSQVTKSHKACKDLQRIQQRRKRTLRIGVLVLLCLVCFTRAGLDRDQDWHDAIEAVGIIAIALCILGRGWCALYIGGRKKTALVTRGPYSISRNPLYVFSFMGAFGAGAQTGSLVIAGLFCLGCWLVFRMVVEHEEAMLADRFGSAFHDYCQAVPRFGPKLMTWRDENDLVIKPGLFLTTIRDACWFLVAVPVFEGIKLLQDQVWLVPLIWLP